MKVAIVTLCGNYNIGNRLQNYGLQQALCKLGNNSWTLDTFVPKKTLKRFVKNFLAMLGDSSQKAYFFREKKFDSFNKKFINNRVRTTYSDAFQHDWDEYDAFVTGSDQVWHNWDGSEEELKFFYLEFVDSSKRISYAPSFGFNSFPETDVDIHKCGLNNMRFLSCREESGCELIRELTRREAVNVIDPTMLLQKDEWKEVSKAPQYNIPENYILVYCLGKMTEEGKKCITEAESRYNAKAINVYDKKQPLYYCTDPSEFVYLVEHAKCVCTDSFHGTVFSLIFNKQFITLLRPISEFNASSDRIYDLLGKTNLMNRIYEENFVDNRIDYEPINRSIEEWRISSLSYLKDALLKVKDS